MNEIFHTEDCGVSLICRCCRARVCERNLSRADRMRMRRDLWPTHSTRDRVTATNCRKRTAKSDLLRFAVETLKRIVFHNFPGQESRGVIKNHRCAKAGDRRIP